MNLFLIVVLIAVLIFSIMIHEIAHGLAALWQGDWTAQQAGRLTLNPIKHLDPWGSFIIPFFLIISGVGIVFGWAKPVPYNPYNLRDQKYGPAIVGIAGPLSNLILALISGILMRLLLVMGVSSSAFIFIVLALFIQTNILLMIFNLLPIPPLDGSKLLFTFLPISEHTKQLLEQYGFVFLLLFLFLFSGVFGTMIQFGVGLFSDYIVGVNIFSFF
ncbi:MAG: site-2 protease family protein [Candidatus Moranbacteria bacterium]|nr:site-2 protease family protein [Candidatus Moranbacteria bacterium]